MMINLTASAVLEIKRLMDESGLPDTMVRFGVETGGCSGLQYSMDFDDQVTDQDKIFKYDDLKVICDGESLDYIDGLTVDFSNKLMGGGFKFNNPNATKSCGCGTSFRI